MPRLSMYRPVRTADYKFIDRTAKEMFTVGGLDVFLHKYAGSQSGVTRDATIPDYSQPPFTKPVPDPLEIQDLLLLENRDRIYEKDVYCLRMVYQESDVDFDLTQFGLFLNGDTKFVVCHYNQMLDVFGRKIMTGDVLEFPNLRDYNPLDTSIQKALPRYYVVQEAAWASEGFSQTWLPHLWRLKCKPLSASQEYADILDQPLLPDNIWDPGNFYPAGVVVQDGDTFYTSNGPVAPGTPITDTLWTVTTAPTILDQDTARDKDLQINDAILAQAVALVPRSGYDTVKFYILPTSTNGQPVPSLNTNTWSVSSASLLISTNGLIQPPVDYYSVTGGNTVDFVTVPTAVTQYSVRLLNASSAGNIDSQIINPLVTSRQFTLLHVTTTDAVLVSVNGVVEVPERDYRVNENIITFFNNKTAADSIEVRFLNLTNPEVVLNQVITANTNYTAYSLVYDTLRDANDVVVTVDGLIKIPGVDYTVTGLQLRFLVNPPVTGAVISVRYIYDASTNTGAITSQTITTVTGVTGYTVNNLGNAQSPTGDGYTVGYLTGDGIPPNGLPVTTGVSFPLNPAVGDYALRLDYFPNRLFRWNGKAWIYIEDDVRTDMYFNSGADTQRASFVNNTYTTATSDMGNIPSRQSLSQALQPLADNGDAGGNLPANPYPGTHPRQPSS